MAQIYKTFTKIDLSNKVATPVNPTTKESINIILTNFIQYIKDKHS